MRHGSEATMQAARLPASAWDSADAFDVAMIGLGYIGLPTAAVIAHSGMRVRGVDVTPGVVETINAGEFHIEERDLERLVQ